MQRRFTEHHAFKVGEYLIQIDTATAMIDRLTARIEDAMLPFQSARDALTTIPGGSRPGPASVPGRTSPSDE